MRSSGNAVKLEGMFSHLPSSLAEIELLAIGMHDMQMARSSEKTRMRNTKSGTQSLLPSKKANIRVLSRTPDCGEAQLCGVCHTSEFPLALLEDLLRD